MFSRTTKPVENLSMRSAPRHPKTNTDHSNSKLTKLEIASIHSGKPNIDSIILTTTPSSTPNHPCQGDLKVSIPSSTSTAGTNNNTNFRSKHEQN